jgi:hypothetical protein
MIRRYSQPTLSPSLNRVQLSYNIASNRLLHHVIDKRSDVLRNLLGLAPSGHAND